MLTAKNVDVAVAGRRPGPIGSVRAEIEGLGRRAVAVSRDLAVERDVRSLLDECAAEIGAILDGSGAHYVDGGIIGAVGISGDTGDNDEIIAVAGIDAAGLKADPGGTKK